MKMNIQIILTDYILKYMYGEQTFQDKRLLSLEVIKKAYQEGLYFVSKEEHIKAILNHQTFPSKNIYVFAGIPSLEAIALDLSIIPKLSAIKIQLPYETLASFKMEEGKNTLKGSKIQISQMEMTQKNLQLDIKEKQIAYKESDEQDKTTFTLYTQEERRELQKYLYKRIVEYEYIIHKKLEQLRGLLVNFLNSKACLNALDDEEYLQNLAEIYEDLESCFKK